MYINTFVSDFRSSVSGWPGSGTHTWRLSLLRDHKFKLYIPIAAVFSKSGERHGAATAGKNKKTTPTKILQPQIYLLSSSLGIWRSWSITLRTFTRIWGKIKSPEICLRFSFLLSIAFLYRMTFISLHFSPNPLGVCVERVHSALTSACVCVWKISFIAFLC